MSDKSANLKKNQHGISKDKSPYCTGVINSLVDCMTNVMNLGNVGIPRKKINGDLTNSLIGLGIDVNPSNTNIQNQFESQCGIKINGFLKRYSGPIEKARAKIIDDTSGGKTWLISIDVIPHE